MAVGGSSEVRVEDWDAAVVAASSELERRLWTVGAGSVRTRAQSPEGCVDDACIAAERTRLGAALLVVVSVFSDGSSEHAASVSVTLASPTGSNVGSADLGTDAVAIAVRRALSAAFELHDRGGHPWLTLRGQPEGALIVIDGVDRGVLPWEGAVTAGEHRIEVRLTGYVPYSTARAITAGTPTVLDVALVREGAASSGPDVPWLVAGSTNTAAGVALAIVGTVSLTEPTTCTAAGHCTTAGVGAGATEIAVGGALVAFGVVGLVLALTSHDPPRGTARFDPCTLTFSF